MSSKTVCDSSIRKYDTLVTVLSPFSTSQSHQCFSLSSLQLTCQLTQPTPFMVFPHLTRAILYLTQTANSQKHGPWFYHHSHFLRELCSVSAQWADEWSAVEKNGSTFYLHSLDNVVKFPILSPLRFPTSVFRPSNLQGCEQESFPRLLFATYSDSHDAPNRSFLLSTCHSSARPRVAYTGTGLQVGCS